MSVGAPVRETPPAISAPAPRATRSRRSRAVRIAGILLIVAGFGIGGYLVWHLWGTGLVVTGPAQAELRSQLEPKIGTRALPERPAEREVIPGSAVAILEIPRMDLDVVVVEGTDTESLRRGPGHFAGTAYPWEDRGAVGISGHRTTYGAPFWDLDKLRAGDAVVLRTEFGVFRYEVSRSVVTDPDGILPSGGWVFDQTRRPTLVLTTCTPRFSAAQRLIVFATRV